MGWERPNVFAPDGERRARLLWGQPYWLAWSAAEQRATREAVAVFDQTSFSKYVVDGPGALEACSGCARTTSTWTVGQAVYTPLLNRRGAYESDLTVTRTAARSSSWSAAGDHGPRPGLDPPERPDGCDVRVRDVTSAYAVFGVMGPRSRDLLAAADGRDLGEEAFPFATSRSIPLGDARCARPG